MWVSMELSWDRIKGLFQLEFAKRARGEGAFKAVMVGVILSGLWVSLVFAAPILEPPGTVYLGNEGGANRVDFADVWANMSNPLAAWVYYTGDVGCHQHANRSLFINGNQMPYCARDTGIFLGVFIGFIIAVFYRIRMSMFTFGLFVLPLAVDGTVQLLTPYESTNLLRIITGILTGVAFAWMLSSMMDEAHS